jgi:hypothetical protein
MPGAFFFSATNSCGERNCSVDSLLKRDYTTAFFAATTKRHAAGGRLEKALPQFC